jgi:hypothetical protein
MEATVCIVNGSMIYILREVRSDIATDIPPELPFKSANCSIALATRANLDPTAPLLDTPSGEEKHHPPSLDTGFQQLRQLLSQPTTPELSHAYYRSSPSEGNARLSNSESKQMIDQRF